MAAEPGLRVTTSGSLPLPHQVKGQLLQDVQEQLQAI